ncbi:MAG: error-prone DNA polymerase [Pseudomonadota bacterium]
MQYVALQVTSNFSFLRSGSHPDELVAQAKALGLYGLALTDHNTLAGVVRAHVAAKSLDLPFIVGTRLDLQDGPSLLCYPRDRQAYGRLCRLLSLGQRRAEKGECHLFVRDVVEHAADQVLVILPPDDWDWRKDKVEAYGEPLVPAGSNSPKHITSKIVHFPALQRGADTNQAQPEKTPTDHRSTERIADQSFYEAAHALISQLQSSVNGSSLYTTETDDQTVQIYLAASVQHREDDRYRLAALDALAQALALPMVATQEVLYHAPHRKPLHDVLTCVRHGTRIDQAGYLLEPNAEKHLKTPHELARLFAGYEDCIERTADVLKACQFSLDQLVYEYPDEPVPAGSSPQQHLEDLTWKGATWRYGDHIPEKVQAALHKELSLIAQLEYAPYFLTVHDIVTFARSRSILAQGRGSAANSAVCYCLGITAVDPAQSELLFERFISPERKEPPDIDVDFEHDRREEVIQYIYARYGRDRAGLAATVISYRARSAVRDVGKVLGLSEDTIAALSGMVWGVRSGGVLPEKHVREAGLDPTDQRLAMVLELSSELTGFPRHLSQHVGGFVLTRGPLNEVVPVGNARMAERTTVEWDKDDLAALGLLKIDVLALGMLSCVRRAFELIAENYGRALTLATVPQEDPATYDMLCRADSIGVFQVESRAQMNMLPRLRPRTFYDLVIEVAIVRPGPIQGDMVHPYLRRRNRLEPEVYPAPAPEFGPPDELKQILGRTKGVPLFQEQAMRIAMVAAKLSDADVNELRKAMATFRKRGTIGLLQEKMINSMAARGYDRDFAARCFNQIKGFGEYGFPESHAASFALLVYVSSWIKCHYPDVFCCALLNSQPMGFYAPAQIVRDAREHDVEIRPADIAFSNWDCTLEALPPPDRLSLRHQRGAAPTSSLEAHVSLDLQCNNSSLNRISYDKSSRGKISTEQASHPTRSRAVRLGLRQIDGFGEAAALALIQARETGGPFKSVQDLQQRTGLAPSVLEKLAAADAFRSLGMDRRQALWAVRGLDQGAPLPLFAASNGSVFPPEAPVNLPTVQLCEDVVHDYQTLKLSLKAHPVQFLRRALDAEKAVRCSDLSNFKDGAYVNITGVVLVRQKPGSAKGVVFMTIEDETGVANAVVWPKTLETYRKVVMGARLVHIRGRIQRHEDIIHVVSHKLEDRTGWLAELSQSGTLLDIPLARADEVARPDPNDGKEPRRRAAKPDDENDGARRRPEKTAPKTWPPPRWAGHPRNEVIIPKSRDFH